jgi:hypothetical protein
MKNFVIEPIFILGLFIDQTVILILAFDINTSKYMQLISFLNRSYKLVQ